MGRRTLQPTEERPASTVNSSIVGSSTILNLGSKPVEGLVGLERASCPGYGGSEHEENRIIPSFWSEDADAPPSVIPSS